MNMGKAIQQLREERGIPLWKLSQLMGYTSRAVENMEERPLIYNLIPIFTLADAIGIPISEFFARAEQLGEDDD